jgi:hypothetical protein
LIASCMEWVIDWKTKLEDQNNLILQFSMLMESITTEYRNIAN